MTEPTILRFGRCEVHLPRREVRLDGSVQAIAPKVYELLIFLMRQRHRAVPKRELIDVLWQRAVISDSVLARSVMQARRAIGDDASQPVWIKTIHGFGYRFVGEVFESFADGDRRAVPAAAAEPAPGRRRIGVMPCENQTGEASLDWTQLGLMALVGHALESNHRLMLVPVSTLQEAASRLPSTAFPEERAQLAMQALGLDWVAHAAIRRQGPALWLDYQLFSPDRPPLSGSLRHGDAVALGERFASAIDAALFPGNESALHFESRDAFVNQAFARGIELHGQEQFQSAARLFGVVCDMEPESMVAQLWRLRSLVLTNDPAVAAAGEALLARCVELGDRRLQAMVHEQLGRAFVFWHVDPSAEAGRHHLQEALRLAEGQEDEDWSASIHMTAAMDAHTHGDAAQARRLYERANADYRRIGNPFELGVIQLNLAVLDTAAGNLLDAKQRLEESVQLNRRVRCDARATYSLVVLAEVNAALGLLDLAESQCCEAITKIDTLQIAPVAAITAAITSSVLWERGALTDIERALAKSALVAGDERPFVRAPLLVAQGIHAFWRSDLPAARAMLQEAIELTRPASEVPFRRLSLRTLLRVEVAAADFDAVEDLRRQIAELPGHADDLELQGEVAQSRAAEDFHRDGAGAALRSLMAMIEQLPFGRPQACARIDAAWLHLEGGGVARAEQLLAGLGAWRQEHPAGLAVSARLQFARGQLDEAVTLQQRSLAVFRSPAPDCHAQLLETYRLAREAGTTPTPRSLPRLLCSSWLPDALR
jgi:DNA-binding winged helix-turn-helix (wHTH) protein/tetratricopeptide (TPR) repeat protein